MGKVWDFKVWDFVTYLNLFSHLTSFALVDKATHIDQFTISLLIGVDLWPVSCLALPYLEFLPSRATEGATSKNMIFKKPWVETLPSSVNAYGPYFIVLWSRLCGLLNITTAKALMGNTKYENIKRIRLYHERWLYIIMLWCMVGVLWWLKHI